jgi:hypothetical protein
MRIVIGILLLNVVVILLISVFFYMVDEGDSPFKRVVAYVAGIIAALWVIVGVFTFIIVTFFPSGDGDNARTGDIRCQRYESHFTGKTTTYEWKTVDCVDISGR